MPDDALIAPTAAVRAARTAPAAKFGEGFVTDVWYVAAMAGELKRGKRDPRQILGEPVLLGRTRQGQVYALRDVCPHRAATLSAGRTHLEADGRETVECPYHG